MQLQQSSLFESMLGEGFEEIIFFSDPKTGLKSIVAIHDTTLGPALGGTRIWNYRSEMEALKDVMRLARAMTLKAAGAGLNLGGGKAVILGDPENVKNEYLLRSYGRFIETLGGRFITGEDVGTTLEDMQTVAQETGYVSGVRYDPSPFTAYGVYVGIKACLRYLYGDESFEGIHVAVQGVGKVGMELARLLVEDGAKLTVTDIDRRRVKECIEIGKERVEYVEPSKIYSVECDVFSPSALGGVINDTTVKRLNCRIVAGAANNQLESERHGEMLSGMGILYAPDFIINAGGLITVANEYMHGEIDERMLKREIEKIGDRLDRIFRMSESMLDSSGMPASTAKAAEMFAIERIEKISKMKKIYIP